MGKLITVSYRLPYRFTVVEGKLKATASSGGLATALHSYFENALIEKSKFDSFHWVGISDLSKKAFEKVSSETTLHEKDLTLHPTFIESQTSDPFYNGFCNSVLWPLFHYFPSYVVYEQHYFEAYQQANLAMAQRIFDLYEPGDSIWIHDYHFMLLPGLLRNKLPDANIGFFLHIPFPSFEVFRILPKPWRIGILKGLLGSDVVGFHTDDYVRHFNNSITRMIYTQPMKNGIVNYENREVVVKAFPISIDFDKFQDMCSNPAVVKEVKKIKNRFGENKLILSVDRLDYTKAIINRLEAYELFLQLNPKLKEQVTYILLLVPSRDSILKYKENKQEVETIISRINGAYGSLTWTPIVYQYRSVDFKKLVALYNASDIALITPVRDGMNLVAKEYIASRTQQSGVLILSETAGSANELVEAILVNPNDRHEVAASILQALLQPADEQRYRICAMQDHLRQNNVSNWVNEFLLSLTKQTVES